MIFRSNAARPIHWLRVALKRSRMVGRVELVGPIGSGFVMDGRVVGESFAGLPLFFTATHVIPGDLRSLPKYLRVMFDALADAPTGGMVGIERLLAVSPADERSYSVSLLDQWPGDISEVRLTPRDPQPGDPVFLVGYPGGRGLTVSLDDTATLPLAAGARHAIYSDDDVVMYRAPVEPGSSGSGIFNENWKFVGLHLAAADRMRAVNYEVRMPSVIADAKRRLAGILLEDSVVARIKNPPREQPSTRTYASVFISYSHVDSGFADRLFNMLRSSGIHAWYDKEAILPGYDIYDEISTGIHAQDKVLFCCSDAALKSGWVDAELDRALQKEHQLFKATRTGGKPARFRGNPLSPWTSMVVS